MFLDMVHWRVYRVGGDRKRATGLLRDMLAL